MMTRKRLILLTILAALALGLTQTGGASNAATFERVISCPGVNPVGVLVTLRSGAVRVYCEDGVYTLEQMGTGRLWDEGK